MFVFVYCDAHHHPSIHLCLLLFFCNHFWPGALWHCMLFNSLVSCFFLSYTVFFYRVYDKIWKSCHCDTLPKCLLYHCTHWQQRNLISSYLWSESCLRNWLALRVQGRSWKDAEPEPLRRAHGPPDLRWTGRALRSLSWSQASDNDVPKRGRRAHVNTVRSILYRLYYIL